jgi:hypothetical protein
MSTKPKGNESQGSQGTSSKAETRQVSGGNATDVEEIRRRAYDIYLKRGEQPGRDLDDWLQAERELERGALRRAHAG